MAISHKKCIQLAAILTLLLMFFSSIIEFSNNQITKRDNDIIKAQNELLNYQVDTFEIKSEIISYFDTELDIANCNVYTEEEAKNLLIIIPTSTSGETLESLQDPYRCTYRDEVRELIENYNESCETKKIKTKKLELLYTNPAKIFNLDAKSIGNRFLFIRNIFFVITLFAYIWIIYMTGKKYHTY